MPDARVQAAIDHWGPRFVQAGIDYNDFLRTVARIDDWEGWLDGWVELGDEHAGYARHRRPEARSLATASEACGAGGGRLPLLRVRWLRTARERREAASDTAIDNALRTWPLPAAHRPARPGIRCPFEEPEARRQPAHARPEAAAEDRRSWS